MAPTRVGNGELEMIGGLSAIVLFGYSGVLSEFVLVGRLSSHLLARSGMGRSVRSNLKNRSNCFVVPVTATRAGPSSGHSCDPVRIEQVEDTGISCLGRPDTV